MTGSVLDKENTKSYVLTENA